MYISNRAYYYAGKIPPFQHQVLSENQMMFLSNMKVLIFPL